MKTKCKNPVDEYGNPTTLSKAKFCHERIKSPRLFDPKSFRTKVHRAHRLVFACPKGKYDAKKGVCKVPMQLQAILHPVGEKKCPEAGKEIKKNVIPVDAYFRGVREDERGRIIPTVWRTRDEPEPKKYRRIELEELRQRLLKKARKKNPGIVKIYDKIEAIEAQKGKDSLWPDEHFRHDFSSGTKASIYGLPDGSLLIKGKKPLWKKFKYD